jgi:hypothetical protein
MGGLGGRVKDHRARGDLRAEAREKNAEHINVLAPHLCACSS